MSLTSYAVSHRPITLVCAVVALLAGGSTFLTMSRRENPRITIRSCVIQTSWEGASAEDIEDLVTEPIEDAVYQIEEVDSIESTSRMGVSRIDVELMDSVGPDEIDQVWDEVRNKVNLAQAALPEGAGPPFVNSDFGDVSSVCVVLHAKPGAVDYSYRQLERVGDELEAALKRIPSIASIATFGVPDEVITLEVEAGEWGQMGLTRDDLARAIDSRNLMNAESVLTTEDRRLPLRPTGKISSVEELRRVSVASVDQSRPVTIQDLPFRVHRGHAEPRASAIRFAAPQGGAAESGEGPPAPRQAILLGLSMKEGENVVQLGEDVDRVVRDFTGQSLPRDLGITRVNDLPRQVDELVAGFVENLWQSILIVLGVAWLMMGWRPALVMAAAIPLSMITTIAIVPRFGVELEQFAIASLIIVLGMVVDNAIVVTDNVQRLLNEGVERGQAALEGAESLARSILSSTLTTVGAFLPMLVIPGATGEYMRSLPVVVSATLLTSYVVAMTVTPIMASWMLRPSPSKSSEESRAARIYRRLVERAVTRKAVTLGLASAAVAGSLALTPIIGSQFFPGGIRDQLFIDITLPTGASLDATERVVAKVEETLIRTSPTEIDGEAVERLVHATAFIGTGGPRLILSLNPGDGVPNDAMLLVNTAAAPLTRPWANELRQALASIPGARIDVRPYELGPPLDSPVEFRFSGPDLEVLRATADEMLDVLDETPGAIGVNSDWGERSLGIHLDVETDRAALAGISSSTIAETISDLYGGGGLTTLREGDHSIAVELRLTADQRSDPESLEEVFVAAPDGAVPLSSIASNSMATEHAAIARRNRVRTVTLGARTQPGFLANSVASEALPELQGLVESLPASYQVEVAGEAEETASSQGNVLSALQVSIVLIFLVLLVQYNSIATPFVVLAAFPLSLIGAMLGLFVTGWPLGFMPMLGIVALAGTVINNAIVLIEFIESECESGTPLVTAVARAGLARMRPILLTTLTTIGGLLPLALFGGPMWAGMSWAMIFGLALSTVLTLVVIPTIYVLVAGRRVTEVQP